MLSKRRFEVQPDGKTNRTSVLNNGLPEGSVLEPLLFKLYLSDLPETTTRKFYYADDIALAAQRNQFETYEKTLNNDFDKMHQYYKSWRLSPNPAKGELTTFHLKNRKANHEINVRFVGEKNTK